MEISKKIKELRLKKGLTLEQVGNIVGVGKSTVRKWETGMIANMKRDKIASLSKALGVSPAYLLGYTENKEEKNPPQDKMNLSEGEIMLLDLFNRVPEEKQKLVIEMIRVALGNL